MHVFDFEHNLFSTRSQLQNGLPHLNGGPLIDIPGKKYASDSSLPPALRISRLGDLRLAKRRLAQYKDIGNDAQEAAVDLSPSSAGNLANRNISLF